METGQREFTLRGGHDANCLPETRAVGAVGQRRPIPQPAGPSKAQERPGPNPMPRSFRTAASANRLTVVATRR